MAERDPELAMLMQEAETLLLRHDYPAALRILDRADKDFPHQRDVLAARELCLRQLGKQQFAFGKDEKEKVEFTKIADAVTWEKTDIVERAVGPRRRIQRSISDVPPPIFDPLTQAVQPPSPYIYEPPRSRPVIPLVLLVVYALSALYFATKDPAPGQVEYFQNIPFVWIPAATSAYVNASGIDPDSGAALTRGFWISQTELTIPQWEFLVNARVVETDGGAAFPKNNVSFLDAEQLARGLSRMNDGTFRVPSAAEWTWASSAGGATSPTELPADILGWHFNNSESIAQRVAQLPPNDWNVYDALGNLEEWVDTPPDEAGASRKRQLMGGSYLSATFALRPDASTSSDMGLALKTAGIRLLREAEVNPAGATRILRFPEDQPAGVLQVNGIDAGDAIGNVTVLADDEVTLVILAQHPSDLSGLNMLGESDLFSLKISHPRLSAEAFSPLARLTGLKKLDLSRTPVDDRSLSVLSEYQELHTLILDSTSLEGPGLFQIQRLHSLRTLSLRDIQALGSDDVRSFEQFTQLETLDLTGTAMAPRDLTAIQLKIPRCVVIPEATEFTLTERMDRASLGGEYKLLLHQFKPSAPADRVFVDEGYLDRLSFGAQTDLLPGYWVYVAPYWYVWKYRGIVPVPNLTPWAAPNVVGDPNRPAAKPGTGVWAPDPSDEEPWLLVEFGEWVEPGEMEIYWADRPQGIKAVEVFSENGEASVFARFPESEPLEWGDHYIQTFSAEQEFEQRNSGTAVNRVRFSFVSTRDSEVEPGLKVAAVKIYSRFGRSQWATLAAASSTYQERDESTSQDTSLEAPELQMPIDAHPPKSRGLIGLIESLSRRTPADAAR